MCYNSASFIWRKRKMAIGERIRRIRKMRKLTQRELGTAVGFEEKNADIRMTQYESGTRSPKAELTNALAEELGVSPRTLAVPDIESPLGVIHTLFACEDNYGLTVNGIGGEIVLHVDKKAGAQALELSDAISEWYAMKKKFVQGEIDEEEYNNWRYNYPCDEDGEPRESFDIVKPKEKKAEKKASAPAVKKEKKKEPEAQKPTRTVDDILAQLRANMDLLRSTQIDDEE